MPTMPSFQDSGLFDPKAAARLYAQYFGPYWAKLLGSENETQKHAQSDLMTTLSRIGQNESRGQQDIDAARNNQRLQLERTLGNLSDTAAAADQFGSGVYQKEVTERQTDASMQSQALDRALARLTQDATQQRGDAQQSYDREYVSPYGRHSVALEDIRNRKRVGRVGFIEDERSRARDRYYDRFSTY